MKTFDIKRWDVISNGKILSPMVYILPTSSFLQKISPGDIIAIKIMNTCSPYDNIVTTAIVQPSECTLGYRPNFQYKTQLITLILNTFWISYPNQLGNVFLLEEPIITPKQIQNKKYNKQCYVL